MTIFDFSITNVQTMCCILVSLFIALDVLTGVLQAAMNKEIDSTIMRQGLFRKSAEVLIVIITIAINFAAQYIDFGANVPLIECMCAYLIVMELSSILENIIKINPDLADNPLFSLFNKLHKN